MDYVRLGVTIAGRVQGVCYRMETKKKGDSLGVRGWVKNSMDGRVEGLFEGERRAVNLLVEWCRSGPTLARVDRVETYEEASIEPFGKSETSFEIKY